MASFVVLNLVKSYCGEVIVLVNNVLRRNSYVE
jgi:hypothetical protein